MKTFTLTALFLVLAGFAAQAATMLDLGTGGLPSSNLVISNSAATTLQSSTAWKNVSGTDRRFYFEFTTASSFNLQSIILASFNGSSAASLQNQGFTISLYNLTSTPNGSLGTLGSLAYQETGVTSSTFTMAQSSALAVGTSISSADFLQISFTTSPLLAAGSSYAITLQWNSYAAGQQINIYNGDKNVNSMVEAISTSTDGITFPDPTSVNTTAGLWYIQSVPEPSAGASVAMGVLTLGFWARLRTRRSVAA